MPRHPDFEKIYRAFMKRYCGSEQNECDKGKQVYYAWLNKTGLDDTKPYRKPQEAFKWATPLITLTGKEDEEAKYYKVEALFPLTSMNYNVYTEDELLRAARTLVGKPVNMNHKHGLQGVEIIDAEYEDGAVECIIRVEKNTQYNGQRVVDLIDNGEIFHVSVEGSCRVVQSTPEGLECGGLILTGLAFLTKDVLPGVPLTRIMPVERLVESFTFTKGEEIMTEKEAEKEEVEEREWDTAYINSLPDAAFAVIEPAYKRGDTEDKRARHLPHHNENVRDADENGSVDLPHLRNALARCNQIEPVTDSISVEELRSRARAHLERHAKALLKTHQEGEEKMKEEKIEEETEEKQKPEEAAEKPTEQEQEDKTPCEQAKESLVEKVKELEQRIVKLEEAIFKPEEEEKEENGEELETQAKAEIEAAGEEQTEEAQTESRQEESDGRNEITKEALIERFKQLRKEGYTQRDAWRLVALEAIEAATRNAEE